MWGGGENFPEICDHPGVSEQTVTTDPSLLSALPIAALMSLSGDTLLLGILYPEVSFPALGCPQQTDLFSFISDRVPQADDADNTFSVLQLWT